MTRAETFPRPLGVQAAAADDEVLERLAVWGHEVCVGDYLTVFGDERMVAQLVPYTGPLLADLGAGTQIASLVPGKTAMTLPARQCFAVRRRKAAQ